MTVEAYIRYLNKKRYMLAHLDSEVVKRADEGREWEGLKVSMYEYKRKV